VSSALNRTLILDEPKSKMLRSAALLAQELEGSAIVVFTRSGFLAYTLGALRARGVPIFAFTDNDSIFRQLLLPWGVEPFYMKFSDDPEDTIGNAINTLKAKKWGQPGSHLVVITNALARGKIIDTMQIRRLE